ncbi:neurotactin-like [Branchiostoma floridae]|uniref:Neurotactin-like n=1 Tax=Branchiostoma floridae TaxID=7739 RepID=A0A9J7KXZ3_BRAFL|nr:neurotactin-like [Branchiostoma floridae]
MVKTTKEEEVELLSPASSDDFTVEGDLGKKEPPSPEASEEVAEDDDEEEDGLESVTLLNVQRTSEVDYQKRQDVCACLKTRSCAVMLGVLILLSILGVQFRLYFLFYENLSGEKARPHVALQTACQKMVGVEEDGLFVFKGIPYGEPPVGPLRWQPTVTKQKSNETCRNETVYADTFQVSCPTIQDGNIVGDEDCLYLNVWTPEFHPEHPLPVIVWILERPSLPQLLQYQLDTVDGNHHKAFFKAARPQRKVTSHSLVTSNATAVHVTFSYRQNVFGFLALGILSDEFAEQYSCNYGLHDQLAALRWVQDNIADFGGDPGRVTLVGEGQAASHALCLLTSPMSGGLFQAVWLADVEHRRYRPLLNSSAENIGVLNSTGCRNASCLRQLTARQLLQAVPRRDHSFWFPSKEQKCSLSKWKTAQQVIHNDLLPESPWWTLLGDENATDRNISFALGMTGGCDVTMNMDMNDTMLINLLRSVVGDHEAEAVSLYRRHDDANTSTPANDVCVSMATDLRYACPFVDLSEYLDISTGGPISNRYISSSNQCQGDSIWTSFFEEEPPNPKSLTLYQLLSAFARTGAFPEGLLASDNQTERSKDSVVSPKMDYRDEECTFWRENLL